MKSQTSDILRFIIKTIAVVLTAALPIGVWYIEADPLKALRRYGGRECFPDPKSDTICAGINKGIVTLNNLECREAEGYHYNAFIFGASVSCVYDADIWARLADPTGHALPYHMDSAMESLISMSRKIDYLDRTGHNIDHALIVLDPFIIAADPNDGPAYIDPPQLHESWLETLKYHYIFLRASTNADFLKSWIPASISGRRIVYGRCPIFRDTISVYDPTSNQVTMPLLDSIIAADPKALYAIHTLPSVPRTPVETPVSIIGERLRALLRIADIFRRHHTDCRIIIAPNRYQATLNATDLRTLQTIFGVHAVHDFSSTLVKALAEDTLLYDRSHYRPVFATRLMRMVYSDR